MTQEKEFNHGDHVLAKENNYMTENIFDRLKSTDTTFPSPFGTGSETTDLFRDAVFGQAKMNLLSTNIRQDQSRIESASSLEGAGKVDKGDTDLTPSESLIEKVTEESLYHSRIEEQRESISGSNVIDAQLCGAFLGAGFGYGTVLAKLLTTGISFKKELGITAISAIGGALIAPAVYEYWLKPKC